MKKIYFVAVGLAISLVAFITCKPDPVDPPPSQTPPPSNKPPVAKAGKDTTITLASCGFVGTIELDGSSSSDPDNSPLTYLWKVVFATNNRNITATGIRTPRPIFSNLIAGEYDIELTVIDPGGLFSKDTVTINAIRSTVNEYDLDITINGSYHFANNYEDCYYYYTPCNYYDLSSIDHATGSFSPIGTMNFYGYEEADTATANYAHYTRFGLYTGNNNVSVYGTSSINLKKIYQSGGGSFNGTFTPDNGSAINCDPNIFKNLAPLTVTGTLDTTTSIITLNIKGKIYF